MPYAPGINWRVGENLAAGISQLGQNIERYTERRRNEAQEAAALRKLLSIYDPNSKETVATMGLGELRGAAQGFAAQQQMAAQQRQAKLMDAQIANFQADNQRADQQAQEQADMAARMRAFSQRYAFTGDGIAGIPGTDANPVDVMRMAAESGVLGQPGVNDLVQTLMRYADMGGSKPLGAPEELPGLPGYYRVPTGPKTSQIVPRGDTTPQPLMGPDGTQVPGLWSVGGKVVSDRQPRSRPTNFADRARLETVRAQVVTQMAATPAGMRKPLEDQLRRLDELIKSAGAGMNASDGQDDPISGDLDPLRLFPQ